MSRTLLLAFLAFATMFPSMTRAQTQHEHTGEDPPAATAAPIAPSSCREAWWREDLADADARSTRARNALIATSAATGLGIVFIMVGNSQCQVAPRGGQDELLCNTAGDVLWPLGLSMTVVGGVGLLTSAIILGVSNKKKRKIQREIRKSYAERRLRWDAASGGFVF